MNIPRVSFRIRLRPFVNREKTNMKNKRSIFWSFVFFVVFAGCTYHEQVVTEEPSHSLLELPPAVSAPKTAPAKTEPGPSGVEDGAGYRIRPLDIQIKAGKPYLPVGAELITKEGKVPLPNVLKQLALIKGFSISWADDVDQGKLVDCDIKPADNFWDALDNILRQVDYFYETEEDTIIVRFKETKKYHISMPSLSEKFDSYLGGNMLPDTGAEGSAGGLSATTSLTANSPEFAFWKNIEDGLKQICEGFPAPVMDATLGLITISAPKRIHKDVERYLDSIKKEAYKQVVIEAKILEVSLTEDHSTGIDWENTFSNIRVGGNINLRPNIFTVDKTGPGRGPFLESITITSPIPWSAVVSAFREYGDTKLISNPKLHLLNGHGAVLSAGQNLVYLSGCETTESDSGNRTASPVTSSVTLGLTVGIKANILNQDEVILYVFPALTRGVLVNVGGLTDCGQIQAPQTYLREMATHAKLRDGEILVIGGLIQKNDDTTKKKVPLLGDIPILGHLFRYEAIDNESTELVILLKPRILKGKGVL
jgi:MSHA biogenesis protein MshL